MNEVLLWLTVLSLWWMFFWPYRDYRLDLFRQRLFALRDELFDLAACGAVPFDDPAYRMLRGAFNGAIRLGHRNGLLSWMVALASRRLPSEVQGIADYERRWKENCATLPPDVARCLGKMRLRLHALILEQMICTSPVLMAMGIAIVVLLLGWLLSARFLRGLERAARWRPVASTMSVYDWSTGPA